MPASASDPYDLAVIGAGPAGLAGAVTAAELGLSVALLDGSPQHGGQFYRHPAAGLGAARPEALHHDWAAFAELRRRLEQSDVSHLSEHHVWAVTKEDGGGWAVHAVTGADGTAERSVRVPARTVLFATGAFERQLPFPGWTLPGVVGAGGAQAMLKSGLVLPGKRVVVAGSGPLLLAVATSLAAAGARVPAVVEASGYLRYARRPRALVTNPHKLAEAAVHGAALLRHRVRIRLRSAVTQVHGTDRVEAVTVARLDRDWRPVQGRAAGSSATRSLWGTALPRRSNWPPHSAAPPAPWWTGQPPWPWTAFRKPRCVACGPRGRPGEWVARSSPARKGNWPVWRLPPDCTGTPSERGASASCSAAGTACAPSPTRWAPPMPRHRAGRAG